MPNCTQCSNHFSLNMVIDGKKYNLRRRKRCLKCSPFKSYRQTQPSTELSTQCIRCKRDQSQSRIYADGLCSSCHVTQYRKQIKIKCVAYMGGQCVICGYKKCMQSLHFHHRDSSEKEFTISHAYASWEKTTKELDKCVLLCSNCHAEVHAGETVIPPAPESTS